MATDYLVCRLASDKSFYRPVPYHLGAIEIRPGKFDSPVERSALDESVKSFGAQVELEIAPRLLTVVVAKDLRDAIRQGDARFEEVLDYLDGQIGGGISQFVLSGPGFVRSMSGGSVAPLLKDPPPSWGRSPTFAIVPGKYPGVDVAEVTFGVKRTEVVERLLRSSHWSRKASWEPNQQERVIYRWFSMEAAWKRHKDDDVVPAVMVGLGFPLGSDAHVLNPSLQIRLASHPRYRQWREQILDRLTAMKSWRNNSVHSGFRPWDIDPAVLDSYDRLSLLACARARGLLQQAILKGLTTIEEAREYAVPLMESNANVVNDVHGTIISGLENPS
jgi:hypothetical protein